jgi:hypothetical protein
MGPNGLAEIRLRFGKYTIGARVPLFMSTGLSIAASLVLYPFCLNGLRFVGKCISDFDAALPLPTQLILNFHNYIVREPIAGMFTFSIILLVCIGLSAYLQLIQKRAILAVGVSLIPVLITALVFVSAYLPLIKLQSLMNDPARDEGLSRCTFSNAVMATWNLDDK